MKYGSLNTMNDILQLNPRQNVHKNMQAQATVKVQNDITLCVCLVVFIFLVFFLSGCLYFFFFIKYNIFYLKKRDNSSKKVDLQLNYAKTGPFKKYLLSIVIRICKVKIEKIIKCMEFILLQIFFIFFFISLFGKSYLTSTTVFPMVSTLTYMT